MPLPSELEHQIGEAICVPVGTVTFEYSSTEAFKMNSLAGVLVEIPANGHFFRVDRTSERVLRFFHSSPGTGTRVASIPLGSLPDFEKAFLAFSWSPEEVTWGQVLNRASGAWPNNGVQARRLTAAPDDHVRHQRLRTSM